MDKVRAKKHLGQHFLKDENIARNIAESLTGYGNYKTILEIGPGMGVLTKFLLERKDFEIFVAEIDRDSVAYLKTHYPSLSPNIIEGDFLRMSLEDKFKEPFAVIGNFPYNISSQIMFRILENRDLIPEAAGMFQKEVAERIAAPPGSKTYGILSVLLQAFYKIEYLFTVHEHVFSPPPKVKSAVIRLQRNDTSALSCDEKKFFSVVKMAFNQRRKTLRNSLKQMGYSSEALSDPIFEKRPEQLSVKDFEHLTNLTEKP